MSTQNHPAERLLGSGAKFAILRAVRTHQAESVNQLATAIGFSKTATLKAVETLVAAGVVEAEERGRRTIVRLMPSRAQLVDDLEGLVGQVVAVRKNVGTPVLRDQLSSSDLKAFAKYFARPGARSSFTELPEQQRGLGLADAEALGPGESA
jgi:predicted ArsR family transcriptional regulator